MFKLIKIQLEIFASLQTLFPPLKIDIFCRIAPLSFIKKSSKFNLNISQPWKIFGPCKRCFLLWKLTFSVASSPLFFIKNMKWKLLENFVPCKRCFLLWKSPFSDASPPAVHFFLNIKWELLKKMVPCKRCFLFENRYFLMHRPQLFIAGFPCRTKFVRYGIAPIAHFLQNY